MLKKLLALLLGLLTAFVTMIVCESINSLIFPFPDGFNYLNTADVQAFTQSLPWTAFLLVLFGWAAGSFLAGLIANRFNHGLSWAVLPTIAGVLLTVLGVINVLILAHPVWFSLVGLPLFLPMALLGGYLGRRVGE